KPLAGLEHCRPGAQAALWRAGLLLAQSRHLPRLQRPVPADLSAAAPAQLLRRVPARADPTGATGAPARRVGAGVSDPLSSAPWPASVLLPRLPGRGHDGVGVGSGAAAHVGLPALRPQARDCVFRADVALVAAAGTG